MSVADLKKYGQMIAEKPEVRAKAKELGITNLEGQVAYAKTLGLEFTTQDLSALAKEAGPSKMELSEEQLEQVAGGIITGTAFAVVGAVVGLVSLGVSGFTAGTATRSW